LRGVESAGRIAEFSKDQESVRGLCTKKCGGKKERRKKFERERTGWQSVRQKTQNKPRQKKNKNPSHCRELLAGKNFCQKGRGKSLRKKKNPSGRTGKFRGATDGLVRGSWEKEAKNEESLLAKGRPGWASLNKKTYWVKEIYAQEREPTQEKKRGSLKGK